MSGSQKFIARNRAPRVQIEYDVELYGAQKKVQLPFVMGVLSDLSGKAERPAVADRKFLEIDIDNFDERMRAMAPKAQFTVPNTLTGQGSLAVDLTFRKMSDFSPQAIAANVDALAPLLQARQTLDDLLTYMDGKSGAEALIEQVLASPDLLRALAGDQAAGADIGSELSALKASLPETPAPDTEDAQAAALEALRRSDVPQAGPEDDSASVLAGLADADVPGTEPADVGDILSGIERRDEDTTGADAVDKTLAGIDRTSPESPPQDNADTDAILGTLDPVEAVTDTGEGLGATLDGLRDKAPGTTLEPVAPEDDLDALMAGLGDEDTGPDTVAPAPDEAGDSEPDDLDALMAAQAPAAPAPQSPFGTISAPRPDRASLNRKRFRMALFGDFSGRAARGLRAVGADLAARPPIPLDVDTVEDVIEGFATKLTLPIGKDGAGIEVTLNELDDLHPDELYDNVEIFEALVGLRRQLDVGSMAERATAQLQAWSETYGTPVRLPGRSASTSVPPNLKLSDFQALIGDASGALTRASPADEMIARIVGPHVVKAPDAGAEAMKRSVDEALSSAMRLVLHHPDFQAVEAQWRALDLMARRIETDSDLEIVLYDISAEELAMDLAAQEDLGDSGLFKLLTDVLDPEDGAGGFSALLGLYTFEETPPHAELLARIGQVAAHVDAPFFAAITPAYLDVDKADRHPLVAGAWDTLRALPEASYLGLASPRFLLRRPYGAKSEPCSAFAFEEFTPQEGLSGMLWSNPVVLVAILLAATRKKDGKAMDLGSLMSLGDIPFHHVNDRYGDQVALPCTERNLTTEPVQHTLARGYMPVLSIRGRNEIRLGGFRALSGDMIAGPWSDVAPAGKPAPGAASVKMDVAAAAPAAGAAPDAADDAGDDGDLDDLLAGLDGDDADGGDADMAGSDDDLDALLAGFDDDPDDDDDTDSGDMDPELAALLEGL